MPIYPVAFQSYESKSLSFSAQRLVNLYWESAPDDSTKSQGVLFRRPGQKLFSQPTIDLGSGPVSPGTVRGAHVLGATPYYFIGVKVFIINPNGTFVECTGDDIIGADIIDTADNGLQIAVASGGAGYIVEGTTVTRITDEGFNPVSSVTFQDQYFIWSESDSGRIFISPLLQGLGPYGFDFATAELAPDNLVKVFSDKDDLFLMGVNTIEPWFGSGDVDFPFDANPGAAIEYGLVARDTVKKLDNTLMWMGSDQRGGLTVYRMGGYSPQRVSTHALEAQWEKAENIDMSFAFTFRMEGHNFYVLTIPDFGTYVYDGATNLWCEWQTKGRKDWNAIGLVYAYGRLLVGDRRTNEIFELSPSFYKDDDAAIEWEATSPPVHTPNNAIARHNFLRVDVGAGVGLTTGQGSNPEFFLQWSDEDGQRFGPKKVMNMGKRGETTTRAYKRNLGKSRSRIYRISGSDPVPLSIIGAYLEIENGRW